MNTTAACSQLITNCPPIKKLTGLHTTETNEEGDFWVCFGYQRLFSQILTGFESPLIAVWLTECAGQDFTGRPGPNQPVERLT